MPTDTIDKTIPIVTPPADGSIAGTGIDNNPLISKATGQSAVITAPPTPSTSIMPKPDAPTAPAPVAPKSAEIFTKMYNDYGIAGMQGQMNDLKEKKAAATDEFAKFKLAEPEGDTQGGATARISEAERNMMARTDYYDRQMTAINDRLTTANTYIKQYMDLTNTDYQNASKQWNDTYSKYLSAQTEYNTEATREQNEASAYLNSVHSMMSDSGKTWEDISSTMKSTIQLEETKAGWAPGTLEAFSVSNPKAQIVSTQLMPDGVSQSVLSKDPDTGLLKVTVVTPNQTGPSSTVSTSGPNSVNTYGIKSTTTTQGFGGTESTVEATDGGKFLASQGDKLDRDVAQKLLTSDVYKDETVTDAMTKWSGGGYDGTGIQGVDPQAKVGDLPPDQLGKVLDYIKEKEGINNVNRITASDPYADFLTDKTPAGQTAFNNMSVQDKANIEGLIDGTVLMSDLVKGMRASGQAQRLNALAKSVDPTYSENTNKQRYAFMNKWNDPNGKVAQTRLGLNTALFHTARLNTLIQGLNNTDFMKANSVGNWIAQNVNTPGIASAVSQVRDTIDLLSTEIARAYKGGVPDQGDVDRQIESLNAELPENLITDVLNNKAILMTGLLNSQQNQYQQTMGKYPAESIIQDDTVRAMKDAGLDTAKIEEEVNKTNPLYLKLPDGSSWIAPDAASLKAAKTKLGI